MLSDSLANSPPRPSGPFQAPPAAPDIPPAALRSRPGRFRGASTRARPRPRLALGSEFGRSPTRSLPQGRLCSGRTGGLARIVCAMRKSPGSPGPVLLGIEGGGTRSVALLSQDSRCERLEAGACNLCLVTDAQLLALFRQIDTWRQGLAPRLDALGIGLAGARSDEDKARIGRVAREVWPEVACRAGSDLESGLAAAGPWPAGEAAARVLVLSGTGSCCFGADRRGRVCRLGGWGHQLGDRGSAYDLGHRALREVVRVYDRSGRWPRLGARLLRTLLLNDPEALVAWMQSAGKTEVAALALEVFEAARGRDALAAGLLREAAAILARDAADCAARLVPRGRPVEFVMAGGMLLKQPGFSGVVRRALAAAWPGGRVRALSRESAWGAVEMAASQLGLPAGAPPAATAAPGGRPHRELDLGRGSPTEERNPRSMELDRMSFARGIELMISEDERISPAVRAQAGQIERALRLVSKAFEQGGRLVYAGAGTSGRLGVLDASECPPTFRTDPEQVQGIMAGGATALFRSVEGAEDDAPAGALAVGSRDVDKRDVVVGIAASGRTPFVWGALSEAAKRGAATVLLCCNPRLAIPRGQRPDVVIALDTGPEALTGSTRLKAGTATKQVLNMLTTLSLARIGKVAGNLMIDLNPSNEKLRDRAVRIVAALTGASEDACQAALARSDWVIAKALALLGRPVRRLKSPPSHQGKRD